MAGKKPKIFDPPHYNLRSPRIVRGAGYLEPDDWLDLNVWAGVISSDVAAIRYDREQFRLTVEFISKDVTKSNSIYVYQNIPRDVARDMYNSSSQGKFVSYRLKGKYPVIGPLTRVD